jgi:hypothetical protein
MQGDIYGSFFVVPLICTVLLVHTCMHDAYRGMDLRERKLIYLSYLGALGRGRSMLLQPLDRTYSLHACYGLRPNYVHGLAPERASTVG